MEDLVPHLLLGHNLREQLKVFDRAADRERLGDFHDSGVMATSPDPVVRMAEHRVDVVGQQDPTSLSRPVQDSGIIRAGKANVSNADDVEALQTEQESTHDGGVEVLIGDEAEHRPRSERAVPVVEELLPQRLGPGAGIGLAPEPLCYRSLLREVRIDIFLVAEVIGDDRVDLSEGKTRQPFLDLLWGRALQMMVDDGRQANASRAHPRYAIGVYADRVRIGDFGQGHRCHLSRPAVYRDAQGRPRSEVVEPLCPRALYPVLTWRSNEIECSHDEDQGRLRRESCSRGPNPAISTTCRSRARFASSWCACNGRRAMAR